MAGTLLNKVSNPEQPLPRIEIETISGCHDHFSVVNSQVILVPFLARIILSHLSQESVSSLKREKKWEELSKSWVLPPLFWCFYVNKVTQVISLPMYDQSLNLEIYGLYVLQRREICKRRKKLLNGVGMSSFE